jgi:ribosomal protein S18 acetylase RimI-like enzyme
MLGVFWRLSGTTGCGAGRRLEHCGEYGRLFRFAERPETAIALPVGDLIYGLALGGVAAVRASSSRSAPCPGRRLSAGSGAVGYWLDLGHARRATCAVAAVALASAVSAETAIRGIVRRERAIAGAVLTEALMTDPGWNAVVPEDGRRRTALRTLMAVAFGYHASEVRAAVVDREVAGVAVWVPPGRYPLPFAVMLRATPRMIGLTLRIGRRVRDVAGFGSSIDAVFPTEPVRYLQALGVGPGHQGRGIGTALLADGLAKADAAHEAVYLETSLERNVRLYGRQGFAVMSGSPGPLSDGGPVMWRMCRPAR